MRFWRGFLIGAIFILLILFGSAGVEAASPKHILFLHAQTEEFPAHKMFENGFKNQLQRVGDTNVEYSYEHLSLTKFSSNLRYPEQLAAFLKQKYSVKQPDLVVTHLGPAADFALKYGRVLFPDAQFMLAADEIEGVSNRALPPGFGGVTGIFNVKNTLGLILQLQPDVRKIYIVIGDSERERQTMVRFRQDVAALSARVEFEYLNQMPLTQMVEAVRNVGEKAAVLYVHVFRDAAGQAFIPANEVKTFSEAANIPVYIPYAVFMGRGAVGGYLMSTEILGVKAAELGLARLQTRSGPSTTVEVENAEYQFDWRALQRWGIDENRLPAGSKILFKELTIWQQYRSYILGGVLLITLLSILSIGLLINRMQRRKAEQALIRLNAELESRVDERTLAILSINEEMEQEIDERQRAEQALRKTGDYLNKLIQFANAPIIVWSPEFIITRFNGAFEQLSGYESDEVIGKPLSLLFPEHSLAETIQRVEQSRNGSQWDSVEIPIRCKTGEVRVALWNSANIFEADGTALAAVIAQGQDITERKKTEAVLRDSEARYRALMKQSFEALSVVNIQTQEVVEVNRRFTELFGYSLPEDAPLFVRQYVVEPKSETDKLFNETLRQQRFLPFEQIILRHKNGAEVPVERAGTLINIGGQDFLLGSMRDMTAERRRQAELSRDVELARRVQRELLPVLPDSPFVDIRTSYHPSNVVSGDFYYLEWRNDGKLLRGFLVDVAGHGLGAALQTASINSLLREASIAEMPLMDQMQWINGRAAKYFTDGAYAAILGFELDLSRRELRYVGAGITQFHANGRKITTPGMFVGMWAEAEFTAGVVEAQAGDTFHFLTDGFTDALAQPENADFFSPDGTDFDADVAALARLAEGGTLQDDATGICLKIKNAF